MRRVMVHLENCMACNTCEAACVAAHELPGEPINNDTLLATFNPATMDKTRIWIEANPDTNAPFPISCRHCMEPPCVDVCSIGAMHKVERDDAVVNDEQRCAGCWMCVMVCPFGAVDKYKAIALKCDLCQDRETPACVEACPNEALEFVEVSEFARLERQQAIRQASAR